MGNRKSFASLLLFLGSALCFFFPFVTVSCGGMKALTLTGQQLATGTTLREPQPFGPPQTQKVDADPFAATAGLCALAGIILSVAGRKMASANAIAGGVGTLSLLITKVRLDEQLQKQGNGMISATYESGFILAVILLAFGAAWNVYMNLQERRIGRADPLPQESVQTGVQVMQSNIDSALETPAESRTDSGAPSSEVKKHFA